MTTNLKKLKRPTSLNAFQSKLSFSKTLTIRLAPTLITCVFLLVVAPLCFYFAYHNSFVSTVLFNGWSPVIIAMAISSVGGFILDIAVKNYKGEIRFYESV